jgi:hypothetical protein
MRGFPQRILVGLLGTVALALLVGCPPSKPPPNNPSDADASQSFVTCDVAAQHAAAVCSTADYQTDRDLCGRIPGCAARLNAVVDCAGVRAACR